MAATLIGNIFVEVERTSNTISFNRIKTEIKREKMCNFYEIIDVQRAGTMGKTLEEKKSRKGKYPSGLQGKQKAIDVVRGCNVGGSGESFFLLSCVTSLYRNCMND